MRDMSTFALTLRNAGNKEREMTTIILIDRRIYMNLYRYTIKDFRSIKRAEVRVNGLTAIVGQNNNGKSALLRALNTFFNPSEEIKALHDGNHRYKSNSHSSRIEVYFDNVTNSELSSIVYDSSKLHVRFEYKYNSRQYSYKYWDGVAYKTLSSNEQDKLLKSFYFVLIPANRIEKYLSWGVEGLLEKVVLEATTQRTDRVDRITPEVQRALKRIIGVRVLDNITREVNRNYPIQKDYNLKIQYEDNINYKIALNHIQLMVKDEISSYRLEDCGSGVQSMTAIAMFEYLASLSGSTILLGIEEPEMNLHPQAQRELISYLKARNNEVQILFTTHSSTIVNQMNHEQLVLVNKVNSDDERRSFNSEVVQLEENFFIRNSLNEFKYYQFHRYKNSDFIFAHYVVITESKNEIEVIKKIFEKVNVDVEARGISFLHIDGVEKLKYAFNLLRELRIQYLIILDRDFFTPYKNNNNLKDSRTATGFPQYAEHFKTSNVELIDKLIPNANHRRSLLARMKEKKVIEVNRILKSHNIVCMKFCLEMDLVCSQTAANKYYEVLNIPIDNRSKKVLLVENKRAIKNIKNIIKVVDGVNVSNLPSSLKTVKKEIGERIK